MPRQNRVTPFSRIEASSARGDLMGNRGILHRDGKLVSERWKARLWISCELEYKGVRRPLMSPGTYTELFFLDEVTALAAGHRPCALCRREDYNRFRDAWQAAFGEKPPAFDSDRQLHAERVPMIHGERPKIGPLELPDFAMFESDGEAFVKLGRHARKWSHSGYGPEVHLPHRAHQLIAPSLVRVLQAGYVPRIHASAGVHPAK